ncbi:MAG: DegT/DnrJ/EryC1/StrS family aminotransferase [Planctomycetota bacterium]|nr:DegT/DnrJ/EryC1/StrS family aminotransferase [Planctomycetota bacterium]
MIPGVGLSRVEQLEQAYADALNSPHSIWLPSARYGIFRSIMIGLNQRDDVYCPAFTCKVVHQAVRQTARPMSLLDCSDQDMLMPFDGEKNATRYGVVLSEVFGYRYRNPQASPFLRDAALRIFDMAMCIPDADDIDRLVDRDVALISFGLGKSLYAGWGGMAFTKDHETAERLREARNQDMCCDSASEGIRRIAGVWLRTLAHSTWLYELSRRAVNRRTEVAANTAEAPAPLLAPLKLSTPEWRQPPTQFHLKLAAENLNRSHQFVQDRLEYSRIYRSELQQLTSGNSDSSSEMLTLFPDGNDAMSHFCIRVYASVRDELRRFLWQNGIDTATLFPFPEGADNNQFPNAAQLTQQIIGLPLSNGLGSGNVRRICSLIQGFAATHATTTSGRSNTIETLRAA